MTRDWALPPYPGRGLVVGRDAGGLYWLYFATGRSRASKARTIQVRQHAVSVVPIAGDAAPDDLRHYDCVRVTPACTVVGNGTHVGDLADALGEGGELTAVFSTVEAEPDAAHTPRIVAAFLADRVWLGAARSDAAGGRLTSIVDPLDGQGWILHTYADDALSASGEPRAIDVPPARDALARVWDALDPELRVLALVGRPGSAAPLAVVEATAGRT